MINEVQENQILWARIEEDVILPTKEDENADFDIYAYFEGGYMIIQPHETRMIPTGLYVALNKRWKLALEERGSTGTKGMGQRCGEVDSGFRGEMFVPITNHNNKPLIIIKKHVEQPTYLKELAIIYPYEKAICQAGVIEVPVLESKVISVDELKAIPSKRGESCLGGSGK